ncbi:hypothetical protein CNR22_03130 [Sphingobacteriaceae bacterium]|nr:hypothetical protein CNR22_03130 [Sphingobacteriaceae bacterium]
MKVKNFSVFLLLLLCNFLSHAQLDKNLVASYYFSGDAKDREHNYDGKVVGATLVPDRFGNSDAAYSFDGVNDYITLGTNSDLKQETMCISLWVKITDYERNSYNQTGIPFIVTRVGPYVEYNEAYLVCLNYKNHRFYGATNSPIQEQVVNISQTRADLKKWYHVVYGFDTDTTYLYVNGKLEQKNLKHFLTNYLVTDSVLLGHSGNNMPDTFKYRNFSWLNGCLDDIKIYNKILSPAEVKDLYNEPDPKISGEVEETNIESVVPLIRRFWYIPVVMVVIILLVIVVIRWRINYFRRKEKERNDLQQKFAQMEMKALRSQMNPHFIFNAINSIQHYVLTNEKELANKYLVKFSQLMRNILDLSKQELISLKDELETVKLYLDIESLRFNNAFSFAITISDDVSTSEIRLPPLLIQPFVENAIWHGLLLKEGNKKLDIRVFKRENNLIIEIDDNGIGREVSQKFNNKELKRRSFGMDITQDRLSVLEKVFGISISFDVYDKKDDTGQALGTTVFINIKL